ncbi:hypothetical protein BDN70DRAFT_892352 [Pholiota conissans]|uniref:mRNA-decapping enzyme 1B n=1 Tax=Pholiota conissans TaxID=109636 RepID=A0A9P5Z7V3_9AGAR|nr:hypothetical protein BDN70DRAFT_892352 [Pholiota conissans]
MSREDPLPTGAQTPSVNLGMSPSVRYESNLKVLRRRDPSIVSIFDQFGHVCVYHHDGTKWAKHGFEGSMFLFERNRYPPYGLYILNRVGSEDYIQSIYPEDDIRDGGKFIVIRSYPDFLANRMASIQPNTDGTPLDRFSPRYAVPGIDDIPMTEKGRVVAVGLWMLAVDSRESMMEVMKRLHFYIKQNLPYPEEYRYGPGRPPPPHKLRAVRKPVPGQPTGSASHAPVQSDSENDQRYHSDAPSASSGELSAVDKLFMKIQTPFAPSSSASPSAPPPTSQPTNVTLSTLFASAMSPQPGSNAQSNRPASTCTSVSAATPNTGLALLDSIFASAAPPAPPSSQGPLILSPQPTTSPPQVLNQDVVSTLLGIPPSRTPSAASGYSTSAVSHPSSREGDNEDDDESDSPSPIFQSVESASSIARNAGSDLLSSLGLGIPRLGGQGKINGDVTPRNGLQRAALPSGIEAISSTQTVRDGRAPASKPELQYNGKPRANRALVPFEPDSELWPYSRGGAQEESSASERDDDSEIMELSFEETSVLSDPEAFDKALKSKRSAVNLRGHTTVANGHNIYPNGDAAAGPDDRSPKGKGKGRKGKKEREARAREAIEKSWDVPPPSAPSPAYQPDQQQCAGSRHLHPSVASPENGASQLPAPEMKTPTMAARATLAHVAGSNGAGILSPQLKGKSKALNGRVKVNGSASGVDAELVGESIIATLEAQPHPVGKMEKRQFTQEVLTLIHTDKAFVDMLFHEYMARQA